MENKKSAPCVTRRNTHDGFRNAIISRGDENVYIKDDSKNTSALIKELLLLNRLDASDPDHSQQESERRSSIRKLLRQKLVQAISGLGNN